MAAEKTPAIILKVVDYSETSCIITMLTKTAGRISALAKGARRPKGPFAGGIDLLSISDVVFLERKSGNLDLLTEAKLDRRFRPCRWSLTRLYAGYYLAELLLELTQPHFPMPQVYSLATTTLELLQRPEVADKDASGDCPSSQTPQPMVSPAILWFELRLLSLLGHSPLLECCTGCGRMWNNLGIQIKGPRTVPGGDSASNDSASEKENLSEGEKSDRTLYGPRAYRKASRTVYFSFAEGGLVCSRCRHGRRDLYQVPRRLVPILQKFAGWDLESLLSAEADNDVELLAASHRSVRSLLKHFWRYHLGHRLKLEGPISQIAAKEWSQGKKSAETALEKNPET